MTKAQMESLAQRQLEAYNRGDLKSFCECYHSEVKIIGMLTGEILCSGMEQFKAIYQRLFESSPNLHCELRSRIVLESTVIDEEWVTGAAKYPDGLHAAVIYGFREGLIDRIWSPR